MRLALVLAGIVLLLAGCAGTPDGPGRAAVSSGERPAAAGVVPVSLRVPAIGVDEREVLSLGVAPDGTAEVPQDFARVGWFDRTLSAWRRGATPADVAIPAGRGPTVLLGHVDSRRGPAVFFRLRDLRPGDVVEVGRSDGSVARYAVERTEQVAKDVFPTFAVFGATATDVLRLVTCAGDFDRGERSYTDNLVVHATRVS
ncbi:class F sortase [Actinomycetospora flava]|uniref:Class F sortase n=1 Tax=Actinomycetospora flava TaxID=3129232 RepID=A0ABU8MB38_9PSEU